MGGNLRFGRLGACRFKGVTSFSGIGMSYGQSGKLVPPFTVVALLRKSDDLISGAVVDTSGLTSDGFQWLIDPTTGLFNYYNATAAVSSRSVAITARAADGWCLIALTKAAGTTFPRWHRHKYVDSTWLHEDGDTSSAAHAVPVGSDHWHIGTSTGSADMFKGDILAVAMYKRVLADADLDEMQNSLDSWFNKQPVGLWLLDPTLNWPIVDRAGMAHGKVHSEAMTAPLVSQAAP